MPQNTSLYDAKYAQLNPEQKLAVDTIDGPVAVYAGPGTGKTQVLTMRIANILKSTDTPADAVLALTFTESACANMRSRLAEICGSTAYEIHIHTFHGFAAYVINRYPEMFPRLYDSRLANDADLLQISESLLQTYNGKYLKWFSGDRNPYISGLISAVDSLKREYVSFDHFEQCISKEQIQLDAEPDKVQSKGAFKGNIKPEFRERQELIDKNCELLELYKRFESDLAKRKLYTFTDMLTELVLKMEIDSDFLLQLQEQFQYILVDEHQDSNGIQNRIVELLASFFDNPNIFVVGDDKQAIYRFQGASPEFFYGFKTKYPQATVIHLQSNYRSHQNIINLFDAALPSTPTLCSVNKSVLLSGISVSAAPNTDTELYVVCQSVIQLISNGTEKNEIAVLLRKNAHIAPLTRMMSKLHIDYVVDANADIMDSGLVRSLMDLFHCISDPHDNVYLSRIMYQNMFALPSVETSRIVRKNYDARKMDLIDLLQDEKKLRELGIEKPKLFSSFAQRVLVWHSTMQSQLVLEFFDNLVRESHSLEYLSSQQITDELHFLELMFHNIEQFATVHPRAYFAQYIEYIDTLYSYGKGLPVANEHSNKNAVRIMTVHKSKGLEFSHVFIPHMIDGVWGGARNQSGIDILESVFDANPSEYSDADERRLFFVALSRAKSGLHMSYSESNNEGKTTVQSRYVAELNQSGMITPTDNTKLLAQYSSAPIERLVPAALSTSSNRNLFHQFVLDTLPRRPLAATHLNNYLADPWLYIIRNIVRLPEIQNESAMFGTAMHSAVEMLYTQYEREQIASGDLMLQHFQSKLALLPIAEHSYDRLFSRGQKAIENWFTVNSSKKPWAQVGYNELSIYGVELPNSKLILTGKIDRLDLIERTERVRVIDYKTGEPKSRNDILGQTKTSDGNYYRQLQFYSVLMRYFKTGMYEVSESLIEFLEPNKSGKMVSESFVIPESEVDKLESTIRQFETDISAGKYWEHNPDPKKCAQYMQLIERIRAS